MTTFNEFFRILVDSYFQNGIYSLTAILSLIQIPAAVICIRNYFTVKSRDYLLVSTFFLVGIINKGIIPILNSPDMAMLDPFLFILYGYIAQFTYGIWVTAFSLYMIRVRWDSIPRLVFYANLILIFYIGLIDTIHFTGAYFYGWFPVNQLIDTISTAIFAFWPLSASLLCCYVYFTITPVKETDATKIVVNTWRLIGIILTIDFAIQAVFYYKIIPQPEGIDFFIFFMAYSIMHLLFAFIAIGYPESFLISQAQIIRACQLYKIVKTQPEETHPSYWGVDRIKQYINDVPKAVFEDGCN